MAKAQTKKNGKAGETLAHRGEVLRDRISRSTEKATEKSRRRAARLALAIIELEKATFDNTFKLLDKVQKQSEELVKEYVGGAPWMPAEGKSVVEEWTKMLRHSRSEFLKTVDKSFDLIAKYVERLEKPEAAKKKAPAAKAKAKPATRKRVTPKKVKRTPATASAM